MKKLGFMMSLMLGLFVSVCALTACSSDDDGDGNASLYGTWCYQYESDDIVFCEMTLNENRTFSFRRYCSGNHFDTTETGTYKIDGEKLYLYWNGDDANPDVSTFKIRGNKAYITDSDGETFVATKK